MAAKTSWHRHGTKLRHCHPMYNLWSELSRRKLLPTWPRGGGTTEALRRVPHQNLAWWGTPGTLQSRACLTSFCHSISTYIYTSVYIVTYDVIFWNIKKHYNRQSKWGGILEGRRFFYSEIHVTRWLLWRSDFTKFNYRWGAYGQ